MARIFVFGSNLAGVHGAGSARHAALHCGAEYGIGVGRTGDAYAIPTKDKKIQTLPLSEIRVYVADFLRYARDNPNDEFEVVKIGCGLAGFRENQISPLFEHSPPNCILPEGWRKS